MPSRIRWTVFSISCSIVAGRSPKTMMSGCCMVLCRPIEYAQPGVDRFSWTTFSMCRPSASTSARICCSMFEGFIAGAILMEVMTLDIVQSLQRPEALGTHGGLSFAVLDDPFDDQSGVAEDRGAPFGEKLRVHDRLREAGLVFEREEDEALRRAGTLADDHRARGRHTAAIRDEFQIGGGQDVVALELRAEVLEQMRTDSDLGGLVVGQRFFERGHFGQRVPRHPERSRGTWVGGRRAILPPRSLDYARDDALFEQLARGARVGVVESLMLGDDARIDELLDREGLPVMTPNGGSILAFARTTHAVDRLLDLGASLDTKDRWGSAPIDA